MCFKVEGLSFLTPEEPQHPFIRGMLNLMCFKVDVLIKLYWALRERRGGLKV